jgi:hypothetical protein
MEQYLDVGGHCQEFINHGDYSIVLKDPNPKRQRFYRFTDYRVSLMAVWCGNDERDRVIEELNSHFTKVVSGSVWRGKDGATIDIRPGEQMSLFTGESENADGFVVSISIAEP